MACPWGNVINTAYKCYEMANLDGKQVRSHPSPGLHSHCGLRLAILNVILTKSLTSKNVEGRDGRARGVDANENQKQLPLVGNKGLNTTCASLGNYHTSTIFVCLATHLVRIPHPMGGIGMQGI
jgi:hypothetical protein